MLVFAAGADLYKQVKRASDSFLGMPSQCFVARKASVGIPQSKCVPPVLLFSLP